MEKQQAPLEVMFSLFKVSFGLSHRALAELIFSDRPLPNEQTPAQMAQDTSWLSRAVVHSQPGALQDRYFADWHDAANEVLHRLHEKGYSSEAVIAAIAGAQTSMEQALDACERDRCLYRNAMSRLTRCQTSVESNTLASIMLIVATACWCDPARAISYVAERLACSKRVEMFTPPLKRFNAARCC